MNGYRLRFAINLKGPLLMRRLTDRVEAQYGQLKTRGGAARIYTKGQAPNTVPISPKVIFRSSVIGVTSGPQSRNG